MLDEKLGVYIEMFAAAIRLDVIGLANFSEVTRPHSVFFAFPIVLEEGDLFAKVILRKGTS